MAQLAFVMLVAYLVSTLFGWWSLAGVGGASIESKDSTRVINGTRTTRGEFPFMLSLSGCGAVLISPTRALTAAHCVRTGGTYRVTAGEWDKETEEGSEQRINATATVHPGYGGSQGNDIAILSTTQPFSIGTWVRPVELPPSGFNATGEATIIGWGETGGTRRSPRGQSRYLKKAVVPIVTDEQCRQSYSQEAIKDSMICAGYEDGGVDTCQGDSGGPMVVFPGGAGTAPILVGLTSWGEGCARPNKPGVYTEVSYFTDWVRQNMG